MYINSKVCFSCSHEKKYFLGNSILPPYFVDVSFPSAVIQANENAQSEHFPNLQPGRASFTLLPLVFCASLFLVYQHDSPSTEHKLRIAFLGVVMCLLSVIRILSSNDTCGQRQSFARQLTNRAGRWHNLWTENFPPAQPQPAALGREAACLIGHVGQRG